MLITRTWATRLDVLHPNHYGNSPMNNLSKRMIIEENPTEQKEKIITTAPKALQNIFVQWRPTPIPHPGGSPAKKQPVTSKKFSQPSPGRWGGTTTKLWSGDDHDEDHDDAGDDDGGGGDGMVVAIMVVVVRMMELRLMRKLGSFVGACSGWVTFYNNPTSPMCTDGR